MPVFYLLVIIIAFVVWLLASFLYKPIGRMWKRIIGDAVEAMNEDDKPVEEKEKNE